MELINHACIYVSLRVIRYKFLALRHFVKYYYRYVKCNRYVLKLLVNAYGNKQLVNLTSGGFTSLISKLFTVESKRLERAFIKWLLEQYLNDFRE